MNNFEIFKTFWGKSDLCEIFNELDDESVTDLDISQDETFLTIYNEEEEFLIELNFIIYENNKK